MDGECVLTFRNLMQPLGSETTLTFESVAKAISHCANMRLTQQEYVKIEVKGASITYSKDQIARMIKEQGTTIIDNR